MSPDTITNRIRAVVSRNDLLCLDFASFRALHERVTAGENPLEAYEAVAPPV